MVEIYCLTPVGRELFPAKDKQSRADRVAGVVVGARSGRAVQVGPAGAAMTPMNEQVCT